VRQNEKRLTIGGRSTHHKESAPVLNSTYGQDTFILNYCCNTVQLG